MKTVIADLLGIIGVVMLLMAVAKAFSTSLDYINGKLMLLRLLKSQPERVEIFAKQMKGTYFEAIGAGMKAGAMTQSRQLEIIQKGSKPGYDGSAMMINAAWGQLMGKAKLAAMALIGALAVGSSSGGAPVIVILLCVIGAAAGGALLWRKAQVERSLLLARAEILPEAERAIEEGRYSVPPPT